MSNLAGDRQLLNSLRDCALFASLSEAELKEIASFTGERQYEAGTVLFEEEDSSEELFIIQEGKVALQAVLPKSATQVNRRITVDIATQNEIVGWSAIVEPYSHILTAICLQNIKALAINGPRLRQLIESNHDIGYEVFKETIKVAASRLDDTRQLLISERLLSARPAPE